jgi:hypothetical protein
MSVVITVMRVANREPHPTRVGISISEWRQLVEDDPDLRWRVEDYLATNPNSGQRIKLVAGQADAELRIGDKWLPFLRFSGGHLSTKYHDALDDPGNAERIKIAAAAMRLGAVIIADTSDEILSW